jgi:hypothetical protein
MTKPPASETPSDTERAAYLISHCEEMLKARNYDDKRVLLGYGDIQIVIAALKSEAALQSLLARGREKVPKDAVRYSPSMVSRCDGWEKWEVAGMEVEYKHDGKYLHEVFVSNVDYDTLRTLCTAQAATIERLERGEFICKQCGIRKDGEHEQADF